MSQTEWITCYTIYPNIGSRLAFTINLIDTPGFGDTRGLDYDKRIVDQVQELFTSNGKRGVATIDAVCFILKAPDARLNATQMYIFEAILSLFGNDIKDNICSLITFADGEKPPVLAGLEALEHKILPYDKYFTFNNSALYVDNKNPTSKTSKTFWEMGMESCKEFFDHLADLPTKSLQLTAEVLGHREKLENTVYNLHQEVDLGLSKIDVLEQEIVIFSRYRRQIRENKDFYYTVTENVQEITKIEGRRQYTTNCLTCNYTCHERCKYNNDDDKYKCSAMGKDGNCKQCPASCHWSEHHNTPYIIKWTPKQVKKKYSEKQKIYEEASQMSLTQEQVIEAMTYDIEMLECAIAEQLDQIAKYNNRLREIALRPDPLSTAQYIDMIIDAERREKRGGFEHRIDVLEKCKKKSQYGKTVQIFQNRVEMTRQTIEATISEESGTSTSFIKQVKRVGKKIINAIKI